MVDFEFEFQYAEENRLLCKKSATAFPPDAAWCSTAAAAKERFTWRQSFSSGCPDAVRGFEAAAAIHPHSERVHNAVSEAAGVAVVQGNSDDAYGAASHPHCRDAARFR